MNDPSVIPVSQQITHPVPPMTAAEHASRLRGIAEYIRRVCIEAVLPDPVVCTGCSINAMLLEHTADFLERQP